MFKEAFQAAQTFNKGVKDGLEKDKLVFAPAIEDVKEVADMDDENKPAEGGDDDKEE